MASQVQELSDIAIVEGLRRAEASAFSALYERYSGRIHGFLLRLAGRRDVADDLFQETWLSVARAAPRLREDTRLAPWLFTIARNEMVSHRRWAMFDISRLVTLGDEPAYAFEGPGPDEQTDATRAMIRLEQAITELPAPLREVLVLVGVEGFDQKEAADILGIRYDLLRQRLTRARTKLAELMDVDDEQPPGDPPDHERSPR